jgi:hypothetical protein
VRERRERREEEIRSSPVITYLRLTWNVTWTLVGKNEIV